MLKKNNSSILLIISFFIFVGYYFYNFDTYDLYSNDFRKFYKPLGLIIVENFLNLSFDNISYLDFYFIPKLITGFFLKITSSEINFSILSNIANIFALFFSIYFYLKNFPLRDKNKITLIFLIIFFSYVSNWIWVFWKLADIYFLFIFSIVFFFIEKGIREKKSILIFNAIIFSIISLITKPQGIIVLPFLILGLFFTYVYKNHFFKIIIVLFFIYILIFPLLIFLFIKFDIDNFAVNSFLTGYISWNIKYTYNDFIDQFSLNKNSINLLIYFYLLILKKVVYLFTFVRETYSFKHNLFLTFYISIIYFFLIINFKYLIKKHNLFLKLTILIIFLSTILYCSLFTSSEPNRFQLFYLVPTYILVSISIEKFIRDVRFIPN
tara:strand:- start:144 stop:1283 length:1140 start_codon:yes stop_codon:yes gene_type:complete